MVDSSGSWPASVFVEAWSDPYATWLHNAEIKVPAGIDVGLVFAEAEVLFKAALKGTPVRSGERAAIRDALTVISKRRALPEVKLAAARSEEVRAAFAAYPVKELVSRSREYPVFVDRVRALVGSWYELFPRSVGATRDSESGEWTSGTLRTAATDLDRVAGMGFDVVYIPPVHPIGLTNRKGRNNSLTAVPGIRVRRMRLVPTPPVVTMQLNLRLALLKISTFLLAALMNWVWKWRWI